MDELRRNILENIFLTVILFPIHRQFQVALLVEQKYIDVEEIIGRFYHVKIF